MGALVTIVGQGLAGTMLGWELERNRADFEIIDPGPDAAGPDGCASMVAAGIINPITGQRIVKSWRVDELGPLARKSYQDLEQAWGVVVWRDMRVRRLWASAEEAALFATKRARGELAPYACEADNRGFWIEGAGHVDVPRLLAAARKRWLDAGRLRQWRMDVLAEHQAEESTVIFCTGAALRILPPVRGLPWSVAKGEQLRLSVANLDEGTILNRGHWILPLGEGEAKAGATYQPGASDLDATAGARTELAASASQLTNEPITITGHEVGLRLTVTDKHPVVGRIPGRSSLGVMGGLGSKGALLAPWLARQWWNHLSEGVPFDPTIDVARMTLT